MATAKLTATDVRRAEPRERAYKLADGDGLYLFVKPSGARLWRWDYKFHTRRTISYGSADEISPVEARKLHATARGRLREGRDPVLTRRMIDRAAFAKIVTTFDEVAAQWLKAKRGEWANSHYIRTKGRVESYLSPKLGKRDIQTLTTKELVDVLRTVKAPDTALRVSQILAQVFRHAKQSGEIEINPALDLRGALPKITREHFAAVTDPVELGKVLIAFDGYAGGPIVKAALQLQPLCFTRPSELRLAEWTEVDFKAKTLTVPSARLKRPKQAKVSGDPHIVPLPRQAIAVLRELKTHTGDSRYLFPSPRSKTRPISDMALTAAVRSLGYTGDVLTLHGFRATARTILDETLGLRVDLIEHQLAHRVIDANGRAYNRTSFLRQRAEMMQTWADHLDTLKDEFLLG